MKIHITTIYNLPGAGGIAQQKTAKIAKQMGFGEIAHSYYNADIDSDSELERRINGILTPVCDGDIVILQTPSCNSFRYDFKFVEMLKLRQNIKLVMLIHDVLPLMYNWSEASIRKVVEFYNLADVLIAPTKKMLDTLKMYGLNVKKQMVQEMWDYPVEFASDKPQFYKRIFFTGGPYRFPFLGKWTMQTQLFLYTNDRFSAENLNIVLRGYQKENRLLADLSEGGYGLVWSSTETNEYYNLIQPYKIPTYLAAGIPIIIQKGLALEETILKNRLGFVVESLEEADAIVQSTTEAEYIEMINRISEFNYLIKSGWFTRKILTDAIMLLLNDNYKLQ